MNTTLLEILILVIAVVVYAAGWVWLLHCFQLIVIDDLIAEFERLRKKANGRNAS